ncbi:DUF1348 family protein [Rhodovulum kholense]|uniref:DUF1348 family protein n=1 Tax=Rhodovulum kholense TaxID=453584 RepID=UPI001C036469
MGKDAGNVRHREVAARASASGPDWRNPDGVPTRRCAAERGRRPIGALLGPAGNRLSDRFVHEARRPGARGGRACGNETWDFGADGPMMVGRARIGDRPIAGTDRLSRWPRGPGRPARPVRPRPLSPQGKRPARTRGLGSGRPRGRAAEAGSGSGLGLRPARRGAYPATLLPGRDRGAGCVGASGGARRSEWRAPDWPSRHRRKRGAAQPPWRSAIGWTGHRRRPGQGHPCP